MHILISPFCSSALTTRCRDHIKDCARVTPSVITNNQDRGSYFVNRWLSSKDLHTSSDFYIRALLDRIFSAASRLSAYLLTGEKKISSFHSCWSMISSHGFEGEPHCHAGFISGVFYLDAGASSIDEGGLVLYAPDGRILTTIVPSSGDLVLFPSTQIHSVRAYRNPRERIVLSFNIV